MSRVFVKICGITRPEDGLAAEAAGADAIGFIFVPNTKRFVTLDRAREISMALGPFVARVGVFQDASLDTVLETIAEAGLNAVQLNGQESDDFADRVAQVRPVIRAIKVSDHVPLELPSGTILLDGPHPGSGQAFNWDGVDLAGLRGRRWVLAGGLTPENVDTAVRVLKPWGVDLSSGVESAPGIKDPGKIRAFIQATQNQLSYPQA
jgi:phosphoribosylanthranilate isomerase